MGGEETQRRSRGIRSLTGFVLGLTGATALIVAGMFALLLVSVINQRDQNSRARRTSDLLVQASTVERSTVDLETGLRGFLITRQRTFLQPYERARDRLPAELTALRQTAEGHLEQAKIAQIQGSILRYIARYAAPLIASGGRLSPARADQATGQGKQLLDRLRADLTALTTDELARRNQLRSSADAQSNRSVAIASTGLGISLLLLALLSAYLVGRVLRPARTVSRASTQLASGDLTTRVPEVGFGEVAELARSFNSMAAALQRRDEDLAATRRKLQGAITEAREAAAMKSNFLANMSHEIRTPLNGVVGMMELLSETSLTDEQREYASVARASGDALMNVVNDVLDIAKIEAGRLELERRDFDLHDLVEGSCDMVAAAALGKKLVLQSYVHDEVPRRACGDRTRVGQILANLLSNAVKFTAEGEVVLEVGVEERTESVLNIAFAVRDTGIGIAPERAADLFEPFSQAESGTTRAYGGTGLGLSIARELARMMGGEIELVSEPGSGSTFTARIPLEPASEPMFEPVPQHELRGLHVLIVDDNATNRGIFEAYTTSWGMRPAVAANAETAMTHLGEAARQGDRFDVVLLDLNMPGRSGIDLARQIQATPTLKNTRLIMLTSSGQLAAADRSIALDAVLSKPVRQSRLLDAISSAMGGYVSDRPEQRPADRPTDIPAGGRRILVAEDHSVNWMLLKRMLEKRGHSPIQATNGREALEMVDAAPFALVLMDCQMPVLDGYGASRAIRERETTQPGTHLPIVAMTANAMPGDRERCLAAGMDDYLPKPITSEALDAILDRWLGEDPDHGRRGLDPARLGELRELFSGPEMADMLAQLQSEVDAQLTRLSAVIEREDWSEVSAAAHRIRGSARMIGAVDLDQAAAALEEHSGQGIRPALRAAGTLRDSWEAVRTELSEEAARTI